MTPVSPSRTARLHMFSRNSEEKLFTTASEAPSACRPVAVTATFSVVTGLPDFHGSAVVTWSSSPANHSRAFSGPHSSLTNA